MLREFPWIPDQVGDDARSPIAIELSHSLAKGNPGQREKLWIPDQVGDDTRSPIAIELSLSFPRNRESRTT